MAAQFVQLITRGIIFTAPRGGVGKLRGSDSVLFNERINLKSLSCN